VTDLVFDIYPPPVEPGDPGTRLVRLTRQHYGPGTFYHHVRSGIGAGQIVVDRDQSFVTAERFATNNYVIVRDFDISTTDSLNVIGGFFLQRGDFALIAEPGDEVLRFGGPSTLAILADAVLSSEPVSPFQGPNDVVEGIWGWRHDVYGGIMSRAIVEANGQRNDPGDAIGSVPGLPMVFTQISGGSIIGNGVQWDDSGDSNGDPWPVFDGEFSTPTGITLLDLYRELFGFGVELEVDARTFQLYAYNADGYGDDLTGGAFGAGVVRFEASNIADKLERTIEGRLPLTHTLVKTTEDPAGSWVESPDYVDGDPVRKATYEGGNLSGAVETSSVLQERALRLMQQRGLAEDGISFHTLKPGDDEGNGRYFPGPHYSPGPNAATAGQYWTGDIVTIHSGSDDVDYVEAAKRIETITFELTDAADDDDHGWNVLIGIGPRVGPGSTSLRPPLSALPLPRPFGSPGVDCELLTAADLTAGTATNGNVEAGASTQWSGGSVSTTMKHAGTNGYSRSGDGSLVYTFAPSQVFTGGVRYVVDIWARFANDHLSSSVTIGSGGDSDTSTYTGTAGTDPPGTFLDTETGADGQQWAKLRVCWTPSIDRTGVVVTVTADVSSGSWAVDDLELFTAPASGEISGSSLEPARADHSHNHNDLLGRNAPDAHTAAAIAFVPNGSIAATNVQAAIQEVRDEASGSSYTDENAQDAVGGILVDSATVDATYTDATPSISFSVIPGGIKLDDLGTPDDNTDLNATTSAHGLLRKLDNDPTHYLDGTGAWSEPAAGTGGVTPWILLPPWGMSSRTTGGLGANNRCIYWPIVVPKACTITGIRYRVGATGGGNLSVALYDETLATRLATSGSVAVPGTGLQTTSFGTPAAVAAGRYWLALSAASTATTFNRADDTGTATPALAKFQDTAHPAPASGSVSLAGDTVVAPNAIGIISGISGYP